MMMLCCNRLILQVECCRDDPKRQRDVHEYYAGKPIILRSMQERANIGWEEPISPWITTEQIVHWLGVSESTVAWFRKRGHVYHYRVGRQPRGCHYLHSKADVLRLINSPGYQKRAVARYQAYINRRNAQLEICIRISEECRRGWPNKPRRTVPAW